MKHALEALSVKAMETVIFRWKDMADQRKRVQIKIATILNKIEYDGLSYGFDKLKSYALNCIIIIEIQRTWRGYSGRSRALFERNKKESIIRIQALCRGMKDRTFCRNLIEKRYRAASVIQRAYRRHVNTQIVWKRMETQLSQQKIIAQKRKELREMYITITHVTKMQRKFREKMKLRQFEEQVEKRRRQLIVEQEMRERELALKDQNNIHQRRVLEYTTMRSKEEYENRIIQKRNAFQGSLLRKKQFLDRKNDEQRYKITKKLEENKKLFDRRYEEWKVKIDSGGASRLIYCVECLRSPETKTERKFKKHLKGLIKKRVPSVLTRADQMSVKMELNEAYVIAKDEVIEDLVKQEIQKITNQMIEDLRDLDEKLARSAKEAENEARKKNIEKANWILCSAARRWRARKELRAICEAVYEKKFDETYKAYYYRNKRTVSARIIGFRML